MLDKRHDKALAQLVRSLGKAHFPEALRHFFGKVVDSDNLIILVYHKDHHPEELYRESNDPTVHQKIQTHYLSGAYLLDPFYHAARSGVQSGIHNIFDMTPDQFKRTSYYREYYQDTNLIDELVLFARLGHETTLTACFGRDKRSKLLYRRSEIKYLKSIQSLLSALCEQHWSNYEPKEGKNIARPPVTHRLKAVLLEKHGIALSPRQAEVALYILQGHSSLSISLKLDISKETVKVFRKQLYAKCNISSQAELFALLMPILASL